MRQEEKKLGLGTDSAWEENKYAGGYSQARIAQAEKDAHELVKEAKYAYDHSKGAGEAVGRVYDDLPELEYDAKDFKNRHHITPKEITDATGIEMVSETAAPVDLHAKVHKTAGEDLFTKGRLAYDYVKSEAVDGEIADIDAHLAQSTPEFLTPHDFVGVTFWIISMAMVGSTVFFLMESQNLKGHWKTSLNVGALVTLIAAVHYFYMRSYWVTYHIAPTLYRYIDWSLTVPLQMIEFYLILRSCNKDVPGGIFWRLLVGTVIMLAAGYTGETGFLPLPMFLLGCAGWFYILAEVFTGEASKVKADTAPVAVQAAFNAMRTIVSVGWSIYPLGYFFGYLCGSVSAQLLNLIYNLADFVNKIAFVLVIWAAACGERDAMEGH